MRTPHLLMGILVSIIASTSFAANRPAGYITICNEGKTCSVPTNTQVAYGRADKFTYKILSNSFVCSEVTFGAGAKVSGGTNECSIPSSTPVISSSKISSSSSSKSALASSVPSSAITSSARSSSSSSAVIFSSAISVSSLAAGDGLVGWGTVHSDGLPTGGAGGQTCVAISLASLQACISTASSGSNKTIPWTIYVKGYIDGATNSDTTGFTQLRINRDNTSLIGIVENGVVPSLNAVWITVGAYKNIIVRNLRFISGKDTGWAYESFSKCTYIDKDFCASNADPDSLTLQGTTRAWIDHNEFTDGAGFNGVNPNKAFYKMYDGLVDIKKGADFITLSYNKFSNHDKSILIGANDSADGEYRITFYRNWFEYTGQRTPRVRNGQVHILNNLYEGIKRTTEDRPYHMTYVIGLGFNGKAFSERNAFDIQGATATQLLSANFDEWSQYFTDIGSWLNGTAVDLNAAAAEVINAQNIAEKANKPFLGPVTWAPGDHYNYSPVTDVTQLRSVVKTNAGVGKL